MSFARGTPCGGRYGDLFADWELAVARRLARQFMRTKSVRRAFDDEDLVQEILLHWCGVRGRYSSEGGASQRTFMASVCKNRLRELLRRQKTATRKINSIAQPFSTPLSDDPDSGTLGDLAAALPGTPGLAADQDELRAIIERILPELPPRQRRLLKLLQGGMNKTEVADTLGINRDTVYQDIKRIQKLFIDNGLRDFLR